MGNVCWAIDLGKSSLKAVRMRRTREGVELEELYFDDFGVQEKDDGGRRQREALRRFVSEVTVRDPVIVSIPGQQAFSRFIKLPPVDAKKIVDMVGYEAQQQIPFDLSEVVWDWQRIEKEYAPGEEIEVGLFAVRKDIVVAFLADLEECGIVPDVVTLTPLALYNFFRYDQKPSEPTIVLDIGAEYTDLLVIDGEQYWFRNLPIAGNDLTKAIAQRRKMPFEKAEQVKVAVGLGKKVPERQAILASMAPVLKDLVSEVRRSIGFYKSQAPQAEIKKMVLVGNGCRIPDLDRWLTHQLKMDVVRLKRIHEVLQGPDFDTALLVRHLLACPVAFGLGIQMVGEPGNRVNLIPSELATKKALERKRLPVVLAVVLLALLVGIMYGVKGRQIAALDETIQSARELKSLEKNERAIKRFRFDQERRLLREYDALSEDRDIWVDFLNRLAQVLPTDNATLPEMPETLRKKPLAERKAEFQKLLDKTNGRKLWIVGLTLVAKPKAEVLAPEESGRGGGRKEGKGKEKEPEIGGIAVEARLKCAMWYQNGNKGDTIQAIGRIMLPKIQRAFELPSPDAIVAELPEERDVLDPATPVGTGVPEPHQILIQEYRWTYFVPPAPGAEEGK